MRAATAHLTMNVKSYIHVRRIVDEEANARTTDTEIMKLG
jgi:hypothetical protein